MFTQLMTLQYSACKVRSHLSKYHNYSVWKCVKFTLICNLVFSLPPQWCGEDLHGIKRWYFTICSFYFDFYQPFFMSTFFCVQVHLSWALLMCISLHWFHSKFAFSLAKTLKQEIRILGVSKIKYFCKFWRMQWRIKLQYDFKQYF